MENIPEDRASNTDHIRRTYTTKLVKSGKPDKKLDRKKPVLVERRIINHKGQHTHTEVDVKSPALRDILIGINRDVEGLSLLKEPPFVSFLCPDEQNCHFSEKVVYCISKKVVAIDTGNVPIVQVGWHQAEGMPQGHPFDPKSAALLGDDNLAPRLPNTDSNISYPC